MVFETYTRRHLSINAIARLLNEQRIPTRTEKTRWERSTVWAMLRNPAYQGKACYGKTELQPRQRITRPLRQRNRLPNRNSANHERPRQEWIEVAVPAVVTEEVFALAQEQLERNKHFSPRRTRKPTLLQGMLVCQQCGYAMYRSSGGRSHRKLDYYRCIGSDGYRRLNGPLCTNRPVRQDHLDEIVWEQVIRLLEDGTLIQSEIDRRREVAQNTDPRRQRGQGLRREQARLENHVERLVSAYQEGLVTLAQLRHRMPDLQKRSQAVESELHSLEMAVVDETRYLKLAESLAGFRTKLRVRAQTLEVRERQQLLRLLVKEILVGADTLTIRHSIPIPPSEPGSNGQPPAPDAAPAKTVGYRLRTRSRYCPLRGPYLRLRPLPFLGHPRPQPFLDQAQNPSVGNAMLDELDQPFVRQIVEKAPNVGIENPVHLLPHDPYPQRIQGIMLAAPRSEPIGEPQEILFVNLIEDCHYGLLNDLILQGCDAQGTLPSIGFRNVGSLGRLRSIRPSMDSAVQICQLLIQVRLVLLPRHAIDSWCSSSLQGVEAAPQQIDGDVVEQRGEPRPLIFACCLTHTKQVAQPADPALSPGRGRLPDVLLGRLPSLHALRQRFPAVVRTLRR